MVSESRGMEWCVKCGKALPGRRVAKHIQAYCLACAGDYWRFVTPRVLAVAILEAME